MSKDGRIKATDRIRLGYIDLLKGLAILLVVTQHWVLGNPRVSSFILSFHMPFFFLLSGTLYKRKDKEEFISKKVKSLIGPYIIWRLLSAIIELFIFPLQISGKSEILNVILVGGLWFLPALFVSSVLFLLLESYYGEKQWILAFLVIICYFIGMVNSYAKVGSISAAATQGLVGVLFYYLGFIMNRRLVKILQQCRPKKKIIIIECSLIILVSCFRWMDNNIVLMYINDYGNVAIFTIKAILSSVALFIIGVTVDHLPIFEKIGKKSMLIMIIHFPIFRVLRIITNRLIAPEYSGLLFDSICIVIVVASAYCLAVIIDKYIPEAGGRWKNQKHAS